ncbi:MAG TPA: hypothetical protein VFI31_12685 [Pirellulales bacterium]|nr:hypothetical protein [Pirellulales bacterium]
MSSFDVGAFLELEELYCRLLSGSLADYRATWRLFADNRRYRRELDSAARNLLRRRGLKRGVAAERAADIVQDALLLLAACLERRPDLGFNPRYGRERFPGWLRAVIRSHCRQVLRRERRRRPQPVDDEWAAIAGPTVEWQAELADACNLLEAPLREVVTAFRELGSIERVAARLGLTRSTTWRWFRRALGELRRDCTPFAASGRLVGDANVRQSW